MSFKRTCFITRDGMSVLFVWQNLLTDIPKHAVLLNILHSSFLHTQSVHFALMKYRLYVAVETPLERAIHRFESPRRQVIKNTVGGCRVQAMNASMVWWSNGVAEVQSSERD